jgi:cytochrome P450
MAGKFLTLTDNKQKSGVEKPPGPVGKIDLADAERDPLDFLSSLTQTYGDFVHYETVYGSSYLVNDPELVGQVFAQRNYARGPLFRAVLGNGLLASEGDYWHRQRRLIQPDFHHHRIAGFADLMTRATLQMLERWGRIPADQPLNVSTELARLTLDTVIGSLFSGDLHEGDDVLRQAILTLTSDMGGLIGTEFGAPLKVSPSRNARFKETLAFIDRVVFGAIQQRRADGAERSDLLSMLLRARYEDSNGLDDRSVRDEVVTLVFAGSETTAVMLGWTLYLLASNAEAEARLHEEIDTVLSGRTPEFTDVAKLTYTRMAIEESMRIYPPVWALSRQAMEEAELGGYHIPKRAKVVLSPYTLHRRPSQWPEPGRFDPDRFSPEASAARPRNAYLPFGGGRHVCIGNFFAMMEAQLVVACIHQRYRLHLVPGHAVVPQPLITIQQRDGVLVTLEPR